MNYSKHHQVLITNPHDLNITEIEREILLYIKKGFTSSQIAKIRKCSTRTVEKHRSNLISKLKLDSSQNALIIWIFQNSELFDA